MNAYIYQAALYCEDCARDIRKRLKAEGKAPENPRDEWRAEFRCNLNSQNRG